MKKIVSKLLKKTGKRGAIMVLALSGVSTALAWFLVRTSGLVAQVPRVTVPRVGFTVAPSLVVAVPAGIVTLVLGIAVLAVLDETGDFILKKKEREKRKQQFRSLPTPVQALLVGLPFGVVVVVGFVLTDLLTASDLSNGLAVVVGLAFWLGVAIATYWYVSAEDELGPWLAQVGGGSVVAGMAGFGTVAADSFLLDGALPGYLPLVVYLLGAPVVTGLAFAQSRREGPGIVTRLLVESGFAQYQQLQTLSVAFAVGFVAAVAVAVAASVAGAPLAIAGVALGFVWLVVGAGTFQLFRRSTETRSDLVVADVYERSSGRRRELSVRNEGDETVDLRDAKIRDTDDDLYRTNIQVVLGAGQTGTFDLPPGFSLYPRSDDVAGDLPGGFSVSQRTDSPVVVTRTGEKFELEWGQNVDPSGRTDRGVEDGAANEVNDGTGVGPGE